MNPICSYASQTVCIKIPSVKKAQVVPDTGKLLCHESIPIAWHRFRGFPKYGFLSPKCLAAAVPFRHLTRTESKYKKNACL